MNILMTLCGHLKGVLKACSVPKVYFFGGEEKKRTLSDATVNYLFQLK